MTTLPASGTSGETNNTTVVTSATTITSPGTTLTASVASTSTFPPSSSASPPSPTSSSASAPPATTTSISPSSVPPTSSSTSLSSTTSPSPITSTVIRSNPNGVPTSTVVQVITTADAPVVPVTTSSASIASTASASPIGSAGDQSGTQRAPSAGVIAAGVIVPVVAIALLVVLGIFFWRRRKQRKEAAEMRQKEMEEYSYNPNNDPTIPVVGAVSTAGDDNHTEGGGYRGWGTTSSATRKASTTLGASSAAIGIARSDSGGRGYDGNYSPNGVSPEREHLPPGSPEGTVASGAGLLASHNQTGQSSVNRGISNASSGYSGGQRSDHSDNANVGYAVSPQYYDDFMQPEDHHNGGHYSPVIQDVSARRNTRIENPGVFPQQGSAGIAQNF